MHVAVEYNNVQETNNIKIKIKMIYLYIYMYN